MAGLQRITGSGYTVEVVFECHFEKEMQPRHPELKEHPIVQHAPVHTRDVLYGCRTIAMGLHYAIRDGETIQYYDVMNMYPYISNYTKFPVRHPKIHVGDAIRDKHDKLNNEGHTKCTFITPKRLYHPVLLFGCNNKLLFCLCRTCAVDCKF